jgi:transketolase
MEQRSTRDAYGDALKKAGSDPRVVVLDADLSVSTKTSVFAKLWPDRFIDVGCAEQNLLGVSAGLALSGKVVFASTYAVFALRAFEQVRNTIAHDRLDVKIVVTHAGLTNASDGASHQAIEDIAVMRAIPGMRVIVPADAIEAEQAILAEVRTPGPAYIRLNRAESPVLFGSDYRYDIGRAEVMRDGKDVAIFATGTMVAPALDAAALLAKESVDACVVDVHTIKPLDTATVARVARQCGAAVSAEEHSIVGGLGGAVAECLAGECPVPLVRVGVQDRFGESGDYAALLERHGLTAEHIAAAARAAMKVKR